MPQYQVTAKGFFKGELYDPEGKRKTLSTDKPFSKKNMPSWLKPMPKESAAIKAKREAQEESQKAAEQEKAEQDEKDIADASFMGEGEEAEAGSKVETL